MIVRRYNNIAATFEHHYVLESRDDTPYAMLKEVSFCCRDCGKNAYVDMSIVPIHTIAINCPVCDRRLFVVREHDFELLLSAPEMAMDELVEETEATGFYQ